MAERYTRGSQKPMGAISCGFKSHLRLHRQILTSCVNCGSPVQVREAAPDKISSIGKFAKMSKLSKFRGLKFALLHFRAKLQNLRMTQMRVRAFVSAKMLRIFFPIQNFFLSKSPPLSEFFYKKFFFIKKFFYKNFFFIKFFFIKFFFIKKFFIKFFFNSHPNYTCFNIRPPRSPPFQQRKEREDKEIKNKVCV